VFGVCLEMKCKNHRIRTKKGIKYGYCTLLKKEVSIYGCKCESIERENIKTRSINKNAQYFKNTVQKPIKKRSYSLVKREKERYSIIYQDLSKCAVCGSLATDKHEVFEGAYRQASINCGCVIPLCRLCHQKMHQNKTFAMYYKIQFEKEYLKNHTLEEWIDIFKIDYRYRK